MVLDYWAYDWESSFEDHLHSRAHQQNRLAPFVDPFQVEVPSDEGIVLDLRMNLGTLKINQVVKFNDFFKPGIGDD